MRVPRGSPRYPPSRRADAESRREPGRQRERRSVHDQWFGNRTQVAADARDILDDCLGCRLLVANRRASYIYRMTNTNESCRSADEGLTVAAWTASRSILRNAARSRSSVRLSSCGRGRIRGSARGTGRNPLNQSLHDSQVSPTMRCRIPDVGIDGGPKSQARLGREGDPRGRRSSSLARRGHTRRERQSEAASL